MKTNGIDGPAERLTRQTLSNFGKEARQLREDAGITRAKLARAVGVDPRFLGEIEAGTANPSVQTCTRLAIGLGADLPLRLYPTTGPTIRDQHQSAIAEVTLGATHPRWQRYAEIAIRRPSRGWIDLGFYDNRAAIFVATEIQSELRRLEQLVRWAAAKATALPSWEGWVHLGVEATISRLLIVRDTRANRTIAEQYRRLLRVSYPGDGRDALEALTGTTAWPGASILWAARSREAPSKYRIVARQ